MRAICCPFARGTGTLICRECRNIWTALQIHDRRTDILAKKRA